jgi:hypothetical protein
VAAAKMIADLISDTVHLKDIGARGRRYLEQQYSFEMHAAVLEQFLRNSLRNPESKGTRCQ